MKHTQILHLLTINLSAICNVYDSLEWWLLYKFFGLVVSNLRCVSMKKYYCCCGFFKYICSIRTHTHSISYYLQVERQEKKKKRQTVWKNKRKVVENPPRANNVNVNQFNKASEMKWKKKHTIDVELWIKHESIFLFIQRYLSLFVPSYFGDRCTNTLCELSRQPFIFASSTHIIWHNWDVNKIETWKWNMKRQTLSKEWQWHFKITP